MSDSEIIKELMIILNSVEESIYPVAIENEKEIIPAIKYILTKCAKLQEDIENLEEEREDMMEELGWDNN